MSNIALITDVHFGVREDSKLMISNQEKFFKEVFFPVIDEYQIDTVVNLGDTFDRRKFINFGTLQKSKKMFFDELAHRKIWSPTLVGNHDSFYKNTIKTNSIRELIVSEKYNNILCIDDPQILKINNLDITMIPWICQDNKSKCMEYIENKTNTTICIGHFELSGFIMHSGIVSDTGMDREVLNNFDMILSGHYHHRSTDGRIYYLGNPNQFTWTDEGDERGFHIFNTETREFIFIKNPFDLFYKIKFSDQNIIDFSKFENSYVRLITDQNDDKAAVDKFLNMLDSVNPYDIDIIEHYEEIQHDNFDHASENAYDNIVDYVKNYPLPKEIETDKLNRMFYDVWMKSQINDEEKED